MRLVDHVIGGLVTLALHKPNHHCRHLLIQAFFSIQACKLEKPKLFQSKSQRDLAIMVAYLHNAKRGTV